MYTWLEELPGVGTYTNICHFICNNILPSCCLWCPPSNMFTSNKVSSSTRCARCVRYSQDFPPRVQYVYEKHFHDCKFWPLLLYKTQHPPRCLLGLRLTQSIMYVPSQVNRFHKSVLVIVQYKHLKSCSGGFYSPESDPPHKIMPYWFYYSI